MIVRLLLLLLFPIKMQMTKTLLPSWNSFFAMSEAREPTLAVPAVFSGVLSNVRLLFASSVNVSVERITIDI